jgi:hypothetical protein
MWTLAITDALAKTMKKTNARGGLVQQVGCPYGVQVVVKDEDVDGSEADLTENEDGNKHIETIWE